MRTPHHASQQRHVVIPSGGDLPLPDCFPSSGLCSPDDPLPLVFNLFPRGDQAPPASLAALGIGSGGGEPPLRLVKQESESPKPHSLAESALGDGGGGVVGLQDSWVSSLFLEGLWSGFEDADMFFADDDALDNGGGGEATTQGDLLCDPTPTEVKPNPAAHMTAAAGGGPVHVHTPGSLGGAGVPNDASPLPAPMPAGAFPFHAYDARRAFDGATFKNASPAAAPPMPAGGAPTVFVTNNSTPPLPAPMAPGVPAPVAPAAGLHACGASPGNFANGAPATPPLMALVMPAGPAPMPVPAAGGSPPLMARMPPSGRALHPDAAAWAGVYPFTNAPAAHVPPSATPSSSPPSLASSGSDRCPWSSPPSEPEFLQPHHAWAVPRKQRSAPAANRRRRPWVLEFPLHALPPVVALPPPANPGGDDDDEAKNRNTLVLFVPPPPGNTGGGNDIAAGGIRRRRPAPRQRNRQAHRVCSHCHSAETPQWRAGPDGPGTLCNACGIRYAADRLLPEYRPSTAPSFRSGQHSNRHRKVMKLREQQMVATPKEEEKPSLEQQPVEDDRRTEMEKDDGGWCM